jgi:protein tyrosine/serine phosphatase
MGMTQPVNPNQGFSFSFGALPGTFDTPLHATLAQPYAADPLGNHDSFERKNQKSQEKKKHPWYFTVGKEILKTGIVVAASVAGGIFGNVPGAMAAGGLAAAAVSLVDQKLSNGKVDWGTVVIDTGLGLIPGGVGGKLVESGEGVISKMAGKTISAGAVNTAQRATAIGAVDGAVMGYVGGGAQSAYDGYRKDGKISWWNANVAGAKSILPGIIGGGLAGGAVTAAGRKLATRSTSKGAAAPTAYEAPSVPTAEELKALQPPKITWANRLSALLFQRSEDKILLNLHAVDTHVLRGAMPESEAAFDRLKNDYNVHTLIDLRGPATTKAKSIQYETGQAQQKGLNYVSIPMDSTRPPSQEELQKFMAAIQVAKEANGKVYVHCKHGIDRTGAMIAAYEVAINRSQEAAFKRMQLYGYDTFHEWSRPKQKEFVLSDKFPQIAKTALEGSKVRVAAQKALNNNMLTQPRHEQLLHLLNNGHIDEAKNILNAPGVA